MTTLTLPWPAKALSSNARVHWTRKAKATAKARAVAFYTAKAAKVQPDPAASLTITAHPPDRRRRDVQNFPALCKAAIDGIADAMGVDDNGFRVRFPEAFAEPRKGGAVVIEIGVAV